jgi:D-arabinose 1-dehydrogenase-like Zn-dependent alcohol dehydrogenase
VDLVIEVGGMGTLPRSLGAIRMGGVIAQIGVLAGVAEPLPLALILHKQARIQGIYVGSRKDFEEMNKAITLTGLRPVAEIISLVPGPRSHGPHGGCIALRQAGADGRVKRH